MAWRRATSWPNGSSSWYCTNPPRPYRRFHDPTMSRGWKKPAIDMIWPTRRRGALRYHSSLNALIVVWLMTPGAGHDRRHGDALARGRRRAGRRPASAPPCRRGRGRHGSARRARGACPAPSGRSTPPSSGTARRPPPSPPAGRRGRARRSVSTARRLVAIGIRRIVASTTIPVRPMPPTVAQNSSGCVDRRRARPARRWRGAATGARRCRPNEPSTWWFLPWMSLAMAPPTVTNRVPGVTGTNQPRGTITRSSSSRLTPAGTVAVPAPGVEDDLVGVVLAGRSRCPRRSAPSRRTSGRGHGRWRPRADGLDRLGEPLDVAPRALDDRRRRRRGAAPAGEGRRSGRHSAGHPS